MVVVAVVVVKQVKLRPGQHSTPLVGFELHDASSHLQMIGSPTIRGIEIKLTESQRLRQISSGNSSVVVDKVVRDVVGVVTAQCVEKLVQHASLTLSIRSCDIDSEVKLQIRLVQ